MLLSSDRASSQQASRPTIHQLLDIFRECSEPLAVAALQKRYPALPRRTLQRWLHRLVASDNIERQGLTKGCHYRLVEKAPENCIVLTPCGNSYETVLKKLMQYVVSHPEQSLPDAINARLAPRVKSVQRNNLQKSIEEDLHNLTLEKLQRYYQINEVELGRWRHYHENTPQTLASTGTR